MEEEEGAGGSVVGVDRKVHSHGKHHGSMYVKKSGTDRESFYLRHGLQRYVQFRDIFLCIKFQIMSPLS